MRFTEYAIASTLVTVSVVMYAYTTRLQFYPAVIYLVTSKPSIMVLGNMAFVCTVVLAQVTNKIFLGRLREAEREIIWENLRYAFTETCLALSTFREEMSLNVVIMFTALLFSKVFHWLCEARIEHLEQVQATSWLAHIRTVSLMGVLLFADVCCAGASLYVVQNNGASVQVFFGFEYVLLGIKVLEIFVKYILAAVDTHFVQGQWYNKSLYELYLKLVIDVSQLFVNIVFFAIIFTYYGVPLHLMRQLYIAVKNVHDRLTHFWRFRRITANLHERFPNATEEDLGSSDAVCIICHEQMVAGTGIGAPKKLLPCGHTFHFFCLRNWLERQLTCPMCRRDISTRPLPTPAPPQQQQPPGPAADANNENGNNANDQQQAAAAAPAQDGGNVAAGVIAQGFAQRHGERHGEPRRPFIRPQVLATPPVPPPPPQQQQQQSQESGTGEGAAPSTAPPGPGFTPMPFPPPPPPGLIPPPYRASQPPLGFPLRLPAVPPTGVPFQSVEMPSVAQYIQGQIEILQLQLQVYQAQVNAANATRKAAIAAMQCKGFHDQQQQENKPAEQKKEEEESIEVDERSADEPQPKEPPKEAQGQQKEASGRGEVEEEPNRVVNVLRQRAAAAALARQQNEEQ